MRRLSLTKRTSQSKGLASPATGITENGAFLLLNFDWLQLGTYVLKIVSATLLTLPIAWERERATRMVGLRTFPLVAIASCGYVLVAVALLGSDKQAQGRIIQGLMTGIGFIGGGAILKQKEDIQGTATAASIWATGAVGAAVGYGYYEIAIIVSMVNFLVLQLLTPLGKKLTQDEQVTDVDISREKEESSS